MPFAVENVVMCFGPFSCMTGFTTGNPQVGSEVKSFRPPQLRLVSASLSPPPWRCAPPPTNTPLSGIVKSACLEYVEKSGPFPGTLKIGSLSQLRTSSQTGFTGVSC